MHHEENKKSPVYLYESGIYYPGYSSTENLIEFLPAAVYKLILVERAGEPKAALMQIKSKFKLPERIYGQESEDIYQLLVDDFKSTPRGTTAMIYGDKGCGKSVIAERCANYCIAAGMPVLYYESSVNFDVLRSMLPFIGPCAIICEEFLKHNGNFDKEGNVEQRQHNQNPLLTMLSDQDLPKIFMVLLDNDKNSINSYMVNRPDRIRWMIHHEIDRVKIYNEMVANEPIHETLKNYLRIYFHSCKSDSGGYDVMKMVIEKARNVPTIEEFIKKMKHWNVPPIQKLSIQLSLDEIWNNRRNDSQLANSVINCRVEENKPGKFPVAKIWNKPELEFFDADQNNCVIDFNELITVEWLETLLNSNKKQRGNGDVQYNDIVFSCQLTTYSDSSNEDTILLGDYPVRFEFVPPNNDPAPTKQ